jgi:nucleoside triphosphate diphosphatase
MLSVLWSNRGPGRLYYPAGVSDIERLLSIMARLRDPERGCAWDLEQRFETIAPYTIEEAYEVDDAIRRRDLDALRDELGDLLLQVVFHSQMASEAGAFDFTEVVRGLCDKLVRRHPNVFGDVRVDSALEQTRHWEEQKATERAAAAAREGRTPGALDAVPLGLPALLRAQKLVGRAARAGFRWPSPRAAFAKLGEEVVELGAEIERGEVAPSPRAREELGDLLLAATGRAGAAARRRGSAARRERQVRAAFSHAREGARGGGKAGRGRAHRGSARALGAREALMPGLVRSVRQRLGHSRIAALLGAPGKEAAVLSRLTDRLRERLRRYPLSVRAVFAFSLFMTFVYMPYDFFMKPFTQSIAAAEEVWFGLMLRGWTAKLTEPIHWLIYAALAYGFYHERPWAWTLAALYTLQVAVGTLVWTVLYASYGAIGNVLAVVVALLFAALAASVWRARPAAVGVAQ